jgi:hypothetical protein
MRSVRSASSILLLALALASGLRAEPWERIGWRLLEEQLGPAFPRGHTTAIAQVEAAPVGEHTTRVAAVLREGLPDAPPFALWEAADFFARALLRADLDPRGAPLRVEADIQNHSWVADRQAGVSEQVAARILRALDHQVERDGVLVVASLRNEPEAAPPDLLAHAYNLLTVGVSSGRHGGGLTRFDDPGRGKPDMVAPADHTSLAVPLVTASAAVLLELARLEPAWRDAARPEALKAILLAGAHRGNLPDWEHSEARPLDARFGAGELNVWNSHAILASGSPGPDEVRESGWRVLEVPARGLALVPLHASTGVAAALCWLRGIPDADPGDGFAPDVRLPNHDVALADAEGRLVARSRSPHDNVELLVHRPERPGPHVLVIRSDLGGRVAVAWRPEW